MNLRFREMKMRTKEILALVAILVSIQGFSQVDFTSSNLPILVINTNDESIVDEPKIPATLGVIDNGEGNLNNLTDPFNDYDGNIGIEIRGSSSQQFPKKSFGFETWDEMGEDMNASILGLPEEEDWILYAPYSDKSLIRNAFTFLTARSLEGIYASRIKLCELVINGEYQGVYVLMEKIKRDKERVAIEKLKDDEISGEDLTGGYILKIDKMTGSGGEGFTSQFTPNGSAGDQTIFFQYEYPKPDNLVLEQTNYIQTFIESFETALMSESFTDPTDGYEPYINTSSFIDYFIMNELVKNVDAYRLSAYMYKDNDADGGLLNAGPIWDYNLSLGNADYCNGGNPTGWSYKFNSICDFDFWLVPFWWDRLLEDPTFAIALKQRWQELRLNELSNETLFGRVDDLTAQLDEAQARNFQQWNILGEYVWPNNFVGSTYQSEVEYLEDWLTQRLVWMDAALAGDTEVITGISNSLKVNEFTAYPNPFKNRLTIEFKEPKPRTITIMNLQGKEIIKTQTSAIEYQWNGRDGSKKEAEPGIYIVQIGGERESTRMIIKQ